MNFSMKFAASMMALVLSATAMGQGRVGVYGLADFNSMSYTDSRIVSHTTAGGGGGMMMEWIAPKVNIGLEVAVGVAARYYGYTTMGDVFEFPLEPGERGRFGFTFTEVPVHMKVTFPYIPQMENKLVPYVAAGPSMSFRIGRNGKVTEAAVYKSFNLGWDFGAGVQVIRHLQVGAYYRMSGDPAVKTVVGVNPYIGDIQAKRSSWNLLVAWFF